MKRCRWQDGDYHEHVSVADTPSPHTPSMISTVDATPILDAIETGE
jgi:hypothetical protein